MKKKKKKQLSYIFGVFIVIVAFLKLLQTLPKGVLASSFNFGDFIAQQNFTVLSIGFWMVIIVLGSILVFQAGNQKRI
jgi:uncharacterized membrane protein YozB (DUF420 family)